MVKLALKGSQDPTDSSLQMKVIPYLISGQTISSHGKKATHRARPYSKSLCSQVVRKKQRHRQKQVLVSFEKASQDQERSGTNLVSQ